MRAEEALAIAKSYTKKTVEGAGAIQGQDGVSPVITENAGNNEDTYKLDITDVNGTFTTPNLKGQGGDGSTGTTDHNDLINRDATDQHPISAITGLEEALEVKQDKLSDEQLQNIDDVVNKANSIDVYSKDVADTTFIKAAEKGQANGVATLNDMGVIPSEQVNISSLNVKGTWDASTNTPALVNGVGESGGFYITSVAGSVDFGAGEIAFAVGDWALYTDSGVWEKSVNASAVQSVNGKTGIVNILDTDVLNEDQLKAVNSGIDEVKVQQIETNKTDIAETKTNLEEVSMQVATNTGNIETLQTTTEGLRTNIESLNIPTATSQLTNDSDFQTSEQVSATVTSEVVKIVADAPEDFDTLKEMSDWITEHQDDASAMNSAILENKNNIANIINDTDLTSTTSTFSASKLKEAVKYTINTQNGREQYIKFNLNMSTISVTDIYGGKIDIIGANNSTANPTYKTAKVVRFSYGDWSSYDAAQAPTSVRAKIGELYYYPVDNYYYLKLYNYAHFVITGLSSAPVTVDSLPAETSEMTLIPESSFASKSELDGTIIKTVKTTDYEYYAIRYGDDFDDPSNQGILIQYKRSNFPPSTYIFSAVNFSTNTRETVNVTKINNSFAGTTYDLRFYVDKENKTVYLKLPSYSSVALQNLTFKSKAVTYTKVDAIPDTATIITVTEYATKHDLGSNVALTNVTFNTDYAESTSGGHGCTYTIVNGICYVNLDMRMKENNQTLFVLPKPVQTVVNVSMSVFMHNLTEGAEAVNNGVLILRSNGEVSTVGALTNESRYMLNFSYPVAK